MPDLPEAGRLTVRIRPTHGQATSVAPGADGTARTGPVEVDLHPDGGRLAWTIRATESVALDAVAVGWRAGPATIGPRVFVHGYQSWSPTVTRRLGIDADPSRTPGSLALVRGAFHADPAPAEPGELRSEQVTILARAGRPHLCVGFAGGARHAGTIRARIVDGEVECWAEAWLGGAELRAGTERQLHDLVFDEGDDPTRMLEDWAAGVGRAERARGAGPFVTGWCSWYQYFEHVTEADVHENLARVGEWPVDVFQLDDGYQRSIGDWLATNDRFPSGIDGVASAIAATGCTPGIWLAPFLAAPDSELVQRHPDWLAGAPGGDGFAIGMYNEPWGGVMAELDTTNPEVLAHLEATAAALVGAGYRYLKLDFTFSPALPGRYADPTRTPAERVRAGYDAIRRGAGPDVFLVGDGAPIGAVVGTVDAMRVGADVAPWWNAKPQGGEHLVGYDDTTPATRRAFVNTCTRSFQHRRLWQNDPDCVMLRTTGTELAPADAARWARTVGRSGGLVLVSDKLEDLGADARRLLDEVIAEGRAADAAARAGRPPACEGLLDPDGPYGLDQPTRAL